MNSIVWKVLLTAAIAHVANCVKLEYIQDQDYMTMKKSNEAFAIFLHDKKSLDDESVSALSSLIGETMISFRDSALKFGVIDCTISTIGGCMRSESRNHVLLYQDRDIVAEIGREELQTAVQIKAMFSYYLNAEGIIEINNEEEYLEIQKEFFGKQNIVMFYISEIGTQEHLGMINRAPSLPEDVVIAFTTNKELRNNNDVMWYLSCTKPKSNHCEIGLTVSNFKSQTWEEVLAKLNPITFFPTFSHDFEFTWMELVKHNAKTVLLVAGKGKTEDVTKLAKDFVDIAEDTHCLVVDISQTSGSVNNFVNERVQDNKIFVTLLAKLAKNHIDLGYLENESPESLLNLVMETLPSLKTEEFDFEENSGDDDLSEGYTNPSEFQDDPVAFSVYEQKKVRNLYYFDFKTIPRLTDKTYDELIKSDKYAVILFTLELEARAIAVLVDFVEIHKSYEDGLSPLYRVECYNWPDVCKLAGVVSTPRMFFYPAHTQERIEYQGIWDQGLMRNAITRFSKPLVVFADEESDITDNLLMEGRCIIGMFETDEVLSSAISEMSEQYYFIIARPSTAEYLSQKWKVNYEQGKLLAVENWNLVKESEVLSMTDAVKSFIENAFNDESKVDELTVYNYVSALADKKPLLILFDDDLSDISARETIEEMASSGEFKERVSFYWMDSAINTTGEFLLRKYNKNSMLEKPILAFFNKQGSVVLKSCTSTTCTPKSVSEWLFACVEGKIDPTYILSKEPWAPRLEGYNFLEMMKNEGTYPTKKLSPKSSEDDIDAAKSGRKGNLEMLAKLQQKAMNTMEKDAAKETLVNDMKKSVHNEL